MPRILLIDDDAAVRSAISLILDQEGHAVIAAEDGQAGLDLARATNFDIAIVDMYMPGLDGLETIARLRAMVPTLPIIATSGAVGRGPSGTSSDVLAAATERGAAMVIHKPFRPARAVAGDREIASTLTPGAILVLTPFARRRLPNPGPAVTKTPC